MKRPDITVGRRNMLLNLGVGSGWIISSIFGLLESHSRIFHHLDVAVIAVMALVLIYIVVGKHEASDEMAVAHNNEAYAFGFLAASITVLILLMLDRYFVEGGIPFYFAGYFVLGIGNLAAGWKFYKLERDGE